MSSHSRSADWLQPEVIYVALGWLGGAVATQLCGRQVVYRDDGSDEGMVAETARREGREEGRAQSPSSFWKDGKETR